MKMKIEGKEFELKKVGREYQGICRFHDEKTGSFTFDSKTGVYHCFGCGKHGRVNPKERFSVVK